MSGQPVLADMGIADQPALDHIPAEQALETAQKKHDDQPGCQAGFDHLAQQEVDKGKQEDEANQTPQHTMRILEPEDFLEAIELHVTVQLLKLGILLIPFELRLPLFFAQRRQHAGRMPGHHG